MGRSSGPPSRKRDPVAQRLRALPGQAPGGADEQSRRPIIPLDPGQAQPGMADQMRQRVNQMVPAGPGGVFNQEQAAELASVLVPAIAPMDHAWAVGLPRRSRPYVVTMQQAFTLALINARVYQLQLENLYSAALQRHPPAVRLPAAVLRGHDAR